ncbi:monovalent cation/H(+) antiporter subunit G [Mongoliitalea daihaiensis]|uniref:monovalent cation/H(+) antiporter subunit G n=1 Tax=Mongoliitalea daihaiensis TaxID=2782006 RepID=UPI001F3DF556|nr:monovalent cation/H(+) antiporter subunit G [Mongoliitalea daihaiensis]UJP64063.1 monovalent cation/H(+) antiporter subunit G [Mongoliitalea daihaiensis]
MKDYLLMLFSFLGALFILSSSIGILRKPDVYLRINITGKASTLGIGLLLISAGLFFNEVAVGTRIIATIIFVFLTISIGGHMLARAAYFTKTPTWDKTKIDELAGHYDYESHELRSEIPHEEAPKKDESKD